MDVDVDVDVADDVEMEEAADVPSGTTALAVFVVAAAKLVEEESGVADDVVLAPIPLETVAVGGVLVEGSMVSGNVECVSEEVETAGPTLVCVVMTTELVDELEAIELEVVLVSELVDVSGMPDGEIVGIEVSETEVEMEPVDVEAVSDEVVNVG